MTKRQVNRQGGRRNSRLALAALTTALVAPVALADFPVCGATAGLCEEPHGGLGCAWNACCQVVCAFDKTCCEMSWSELCVDYAADFCADIPCPREGPCLEGHDGPGCEEEPCCFLMCRLDPYCCNSRWDNWCGIEAVQLCGAPQCSLVVPSGARIEEELCGERINDGCNIASLLFDTIACGETVLGVVSSGAPRDSDWYTIELDRPTTLTATFSPEFPGEVMIVEGPCSRTRVHDVQSGFGCVPSTLSIDLAPGTWWVVVSLATEVRSVHRGMGCPDSKDPQAQPPAFNNRYLLSVSCDGGGIAIPGDLNSDGIVNGADLGILLQSWGSCASCAADLNGDGVVDGSDLGLLLQAWSI